jgi:hypothetical protein
MSNDLPLSMILITHSTLSKGLRNRELHVLFGIILEYYFIVYISKLSISYFDLG